MSLSTSELVKPRFKLPTPEALEIFERAIEENVKLQEQFKSDVLEQTDRILASGSFHRCGPRLRGLLRYVVTKYLQGESDQINQSAIFEHLFKKDSAGHAEGLGSAREAAARLRSQLDRYYQKEGKNDPIRISIPTGKYVPQIRDTRHSLLVKPFLNPLGKQNHVGKALTEELLYLLGLEEHLRVQKVGHLRIDKYTAYGGVYCSYVVSGDEVKIVCYFANFHTGLVDVQHFSGRRNVVFDLAAKLANFVVTAARPEHSGKKV